jgi:hypothetical protein
LLVDIALHVRLHPLRRGGIRIAGLGIVLFPVDVAADAVLLAREARLFGRGELAVTQGPRLLTLHGRLLALEARGFTGGELAGLQALLDALLLIDVTLRITQLSRRSPTETP